MYIFEFFSWIVKLKYNFFLNFGGLSVRLKIYIFNKLKIFYLFLNTYVVSIIKNTNMFWIIVFEPPVIIIYFNKLTNWWKIIVYEETCQYLWIRKTSNYILDNGKKMWGKS